MEREREELESVELETSKVLSSMVGSGFAVWVISYWIPFWACASFTIPALWVALGSERLFGKWRIVRGFGSRSLALIGAMGLPMAVTAYQHKEYIPTTVSQDQSPSEQPIVPPLVVDEPHVVKPKKEVVVQDIKESVPFRVAVLEFTNRLVKKDQRVINRYFLSDVARGEILTARTNATVFSRDNLNILLGQNSTYLSDCGNCDIDIGRMAGADYVVTGTIDRVGDSFKVSLLLHRTDDDGKLMASAVATSDVPEGLEKSLRTAVREILKGLD